MVSSMQPKTPAAGPVPVPIPMLARFTTFARSALTGGAATLADLTVIAFATSVLHASPKAANVPALLVGAVVQFFGNKHFAFRARGGNLRRQAALFVATEAVALVLNAALYHAVASLFPLVPATAVLARAITTNLVFLLWSYPVWKRVFAVPASRVAA
jgi:putative flippase GtrA